MLRPISILLLTVLFTSQLNGQNSLKKYCVIESYLKNGWNTHVSYRVITGKVDSLNVPADTSGLYLINSLITVPDILNFMGSRGWKLAAAATYSHSDRETQYYFEKDFIKHASY